MATQLHTVRLTREDTSIPWGFRLEGGVDIGHAVNIQRVQPGSVADYCGLRAGDQVIRINRSETKWMRHEDAKMEIIRSGNDIEMLIERGGVHVIKSSAPVTMMPSNNWDRSLPSQTVTTGAVWQPKIVQTSHTGPQNVLTTRTSLETTNQRYDESIGVSHNVSPLPFGQAPPKPGESLVAQGTDGRFRQIKHSSYNSPMGLYTTNNLNQTFERTVSSVSSTGVHRPAPRPSGGARPRTDTETKYCGSCGEFIRDVFVRVQGRVPMHPECLKCCKCGVGLRNVGYFYIDEKLYCERHAKQAAPPPEPGMKPVVVYK
ncbi:hypothetical protein P879_08409 [Paragonimus westermani]|uniref:PDZ and LIM domain protein Zasp n=1 Tax=Paragonimus westermani TaxID=34504 RepID=A0A8T0DPF4_9TREM|nr:hypothetical protein P879_08409 [Paragonimus westermani]